MSTKIKECTRCVLTEADDPDIFFNKDGVCNHCVNYDSMAAIHLHKGEAADKKLKALAEKIKADGRNKKYDCIIGLSGGVDSTYLAIKVKELGLRPLAIHLDNGWDSELAVQNIENIVNRLGIDLYTHVIDWEEFKQLQLAYLRASVIDIEVITDHAILAIIYKLAYKYRIKYILSGTNIVTEAVLPENWIFNKRDHINIKAIYKRFGIKEELKTFPFMDKFVKIFIIKIFKIQSVSLLNYLDYNKDKVKEIIKDQLGWKDYGGKHYESIFTRFYQGYILPVKFKVDKRKAHLSNLICSGQITKNEALEELKKPPYNPIVFNEDYDFVIKKLGLSASEFEEIMKLPISKHTDYEYEQSIYINYPYLKGFKHIIQLFRHLSNKVRLIQE